MRLATLCHAVALFQFFILSSAIPLDSISTPNRRQCCSNVPVIASDNLNDPSNLTPQFPRALLDNTVYRVRTSNVVLKMTLSQWSRKSPLHDLLTDAYLLVRAVQEEQGLGLVPGGRFERQGVNVALRMWNANNHQLTWSVVGLVILGLLDYIEPNGLLAPAVVMKIFDGANQVGEGTLAVTAGS